MRKLQEFLFILFCRACSRSARDSFIVASHLGDFFFFCSFIVVLIVRSRSLSQKSRGGTYCFKNKKKSVKIILNKRKPWACFFYLSRNEQTAESREEEEQKILYARCLKKMQRAQQKSMQWTACSVSEDSEGVPLTYIYSTIFG